MKNTLYSEQIEVPLSKLKLDPNNIRFRHMGKLTESQIQEYLLQEEDVRLLTKEIINARQLYQPLLVTKDGDYMICKEGNRRCLSLRMIQEQIRNGKLKEFTEDHFSMVPCIILTGTEKQIDVLLGTIHVSGAKPWKSTNRSSTSRGASLVSRFHLHRLVEPEAVAHPGFAGHVAMIVAWHQPLGTAPLDAVVLAFAETADTLHGVQ